MNKNEISIIEIYENLGVMGFDISLENLAKMTPTELKKFYKKARKAYDLYYSLKRILCQLCAEEIEEEAE